LGAVATDPGSAEATMFITDKGAKTAIKRGWFFQDKKMAD
jgi:hypothetical protein